MNEIEITQNNKIAFISMNRAPVNALSCEYIRNLSIAIKEVGQYEVKCLIIHSKLSHFCAGADLKERKTMKEPNILKAVKNIQNCFNQIYELEIPVISVINGAALGGGMELALACDFRISEDDAVLGFPETELGIIPGAGGTQRLSRLIGISKAKYYIYTGERISSKEALEIGLIDVLSEKDEGLKDAIKLANKIINKKKEAIVNAKKSINMGYDLTIRESLEIESDCYRESRK